MGFWLFGCLVVWLFVLVVTTKNHLLPLRTVPPPRSPLYERTVLRDVVERRLLLLSKLPPRGVVVMVRLGRVLAIGLLGRSVRVGLLGRSVRVGVLGRSGRVGPLGRSGRVGLPGRSGRLGWVATLSWLGRVGRRPTLYMSS